MDPNVREWLTTLTPLIGLAVPILVKLTDLKKEITASNNDTKQAIQDIDRRLEEADKNTKQSFQDIDKRLDDSKEYRYNSLRYHLHKDLNEHIKIGYISERNFIEISKIYEYGHTKLGINNEITALYEKVKKLERIED